MKKKRTDAQRRCPHCGQKANQINKGYNRSGTQRCMCMDCNNVYPESQEPSVQGEEVREQAIKTFYSGVSGRGVGALIKMSKANVYRWIKNEVSVEKPKGYLELDEWYQFIGSKPRTETRKNVYLMTMVSRTSRQIVGFDIAYDKSPERIQAIVDKAPYVEQYCSDGWLGHIDMVYPGYYRRNAHDKSDTHIVERVNADLRHSIPILARRSWCFACTFETLRAVVEVFVDAYNRFGLAKYHYRLHQNNGGLPFAPVGFI